MALPTKDDLSTLNYVYQGAPFVQVEAKNLNSATLDVVYQAQPFVAAGLSLVNYFVNVAGTWKAASSVFVNVSGIWKLVSTTSVKVSGAWKT